MAKKSLIARLRDKQKKIKESGQGYPYFLIPEGVTRMRPVWCGEDQDWSLEVVFFYLGKEMGGFISPATFGEKCAFHRMHKKLSDSKDEDEREYAKNKLRPGRKFAVGVYRYKDAEGTEVDEQSGVKCAILAPSVVDKMLDLYLDADNGDFTDPIKGYDLKFKRTGKGKNDTEYNVVKGKNTKASKKFRGPYNIEELVRKILPTYEQTKEMLEKYMNLAPDDEAESSTKKKKPIKKKVKKSKDL